MQTKVMAIGIGKLMGKFKEILLRRGDRLTGVGF